MLASTMQLTNNTPTPTTTNHSQQQQGGNKTTHAASHPNSVPTTNNPQPALFPTPQRGVLKHEKKTTRLLLMFHPTPKALHTLGAEHSTPQNGCAGYKSDTP